MALMFGRQIYVYKHLLLQGNSYEKKEVVAHVQRGTGIWHGFKLCCSNILVPSFNNNFVLIIIIHQYVYKGTLY